MKGVSVNHLSSPSLNALFKNMPRGMVFGGMLVGALLAFEIFNYSTTDFALTDLLGSQLKFAGVRWATILSIAFCGIDFAGIARLFTPEKGNEEPTEVWYLFGAWLLAASMNAILTWWGVSLAIMSHTVTGSALVSPATMTQAIPVFVAVMVWLIRLLIIGTLSMAGDRIFSMGSHASERPLSKAMRPAAAPRPAAASAARPRPERQPFNQAAAPDPEEEEDRPVPGRPAFQRSEPSYHPIGMAARNRDPQGKLRR
jgi:hypothetical protein